MIAGSRLPLRRLNSPATSPRMTAPNATTAPTSKWIMPNSSAVNATAPFLLTRALLPGMVAREHGHIITLGSVAETVVHRAERPVLLVRPGT